MEIKTCEEYVLAELAETKENLVRVGESNIRLREESDRMKSDLRFLVSLIEKKEYGVSEEAYYKLNVNEKTYDGKLNEAFTLLNRIIEEYK